MLRRAPLYAFLALFLSDCAHRPLEKRELASSPTRPNSQYNFVINQNGSEPGTFHLDVEYSLSLDARKTFSKQLVLFRNANFNNQVSTLLAPQKPFPLSMARTEVKRKDTSPGTYDYITVAYAHHFRLFTATANKMHCTETLNEKPGKGYWRQDCAVDLEYDDAKIYMKSLSMWTDCKEKDFQMNCKFGFDGIMNEVKVPLCARVFAPDHYSASQISFLTVENFAHVLFALQKISTFDLPYEMNLNDAVTSYVKSFEYKNVHKINSRYPSVTFIPKDVTGNESD